MQGRRGGNVPLWRHFVCRRGCEAVAARRCVYADRVRASTLRDMDTSKPASQFVRLVMPNATEEEIEEATRHWFAYLRLLDEIANEPDASDDSRNGDAYVRFGNNTPPDV